MAGETDLEGRTISQEISMNFNNKGVSEQTQTFVESLEFVRLSDGEYIRCCREIIVGRTSYLVHSWKKIE